MTKKAFIVVTTIKVPKIVKDFFDNLEKFGHKKDVGFIIIGDKKSPNLASDVFCKKFKKKGFEVEFFSIQKQKKWLKSFPKFQKIVPYNSDNRRNIGYLIALQKGCDFIISIDDDNFPLSDVDFFKYHCIVGEEKESFVIKTTSKWFNICELLMKKPDWQIYPRGYPYRERWKENLIVKTRKKVKIMLNEGLWLNDPDVDSITRINRDVKITKFFNEQIILDIGTWSPINTQNTAIHIEILPAFYFVIMGEKIENLVIDRYGDIWAGLFVKKVMDKLGYYASFGNPIVNHIRNKHNLFNDLKQELGCIIYTEVLAEILENIKLKGKNAIDCYADLTDKVLKFSLKEKMINPEFKKYLKKLNYAQNVWLETIQKIKK